MAKAPVSACIITREDPHLEACIKSFRDYVEELVIVITSETDTASIEIAKKYADKWECFTKCNDPQTGMIEDFSMARNRSFDLATKQWVLWADSDDLIVGAEKLNDVITSFDATRTDIDGVAFLFPYEYSYNERGQVSCRHYRERLFSNKKFFRFINPVHEVVVPLEGSRVSLLPREELVFKHQRQYSPKQVESGRNLRILKKYFETTGGKDARQMYYLGLECANAGLIDESIMHLSKYVDISGWDDERVMACYKLVDIFQALGQYDNGLKWAFKAIEIKENWFEGYYALTRMFYFLACMGGAAEGRNWEKCVHFGKLALTYPPTQTLLFINTSDRDEIHKYLNVALNKMGDVKGALESVKTGQQNQPDDPTFAHNRRLYEVFISKQQIVESLNLLKGNKEIDVPESDLIVGLLNKQVSANSVNTTPTQSLAHTNVPAIMDIDVPPVNCRFPITNLTKGPNVWGIPREWNFDGYPIKMMDEQLQAVVIMIWKQYMLNDEVLSAIYFLENAPHNVRHSPSTEKALAMTREAFIKKNVNAPFTIHNDVVRSINVYETMVNPAAEMFTPAKRMLTQNGKFLLTTQHGSKLNGEYVETCEPWSLASEGKHWLSASTRSNTVAPTVWSVVDNFHLAGYWVKNSYVASKQGAPTHTFENTNEIFAEAYMKSPYHSDTLDVVMFAGDGIEAWTPETVKATGIGGSELMLLEQAKRLAALGHKVRVYSGCGRNGEGIYDGVEYRESGKFHDLKCDVLVVSRNASALDDSLNIQAKLKLLWVHDVWAMNATNELLLKADRILALSEWHKQNLINVHNVHPDHVLVTRNGIDLARFDKKVERNRFKCINSSSPDRSWPVLLECWPKIKEQVPQAELHLFYGFKNWKFMAQARNDKAQVDLINYLEFKIKEMAPLGVVYHDRVSQAELAEEFLSAGAWIFPSWFSETSCISGMEAQAAGCRIITSNIAALKETVADRGVLLDGDWTSAEYKEKFMRTVVKALNNYNESDREMLQQYAREHFGLNELAKDWEKMFYDLIDGKKSNPIVPYMPTQVYRAKIEGSK